MKQKYKFSRPRLVVFLLCFCLVGILIWRSLAATTPNLPGDITGDGHVDSTDLGFMIANYNTVYAPADFNNSGKVDGSDFATLLKYYGTSSPTPTASLSASPASITSGQSSTLTWNSSNSTSCTASGAWSGSKATSGSQSVSPTTTSTYTITCSGAGGTSTPASTTVTVNNTSGGLSSTCGALPTAPSTYSHVVWIWMENKTYDSVFGSGASSAPYENNLKNQCAYGTQYLDNAESDLPSEPNYLAGTSGSNCNTGNDNNGSGCITDDNPPSSHTLSTVSIFQQIKSAGKTWKSYQEDMSSNCNLSNSGQYAVKHNPAAFYTNIRTDCNSVDVSFPSIACSSSSCPAPPAGSLSSDINNGSLPSFSFITPDMCNDTHDCAVAVGDQWLSVWLPKLIGGPNYQSGNTAIFLIWDEGNANQPTPNIFINPYAPAGTIISTAFNHFAVLRATEEMLGLSPFLGCASGTAPGGGNCPSGSTVEIRQLFHM